MCVDISHLNQYLQQEQYMSPTPAEAIADIAAANAKYFTVLDAMKDYHQCLLDQDSQLLTAFIIPFGRFKYLRAPYGISSISEHYNRHREEALADLLGFHRIVNDIAICDGDDHIANVRGFVQHCADKQIALNPQKCIFGATEVTFAGFRLSQESYQVDKSITDAISQFPKSTNRTELRSFFGLANQLSSIVNTIATLLTPLRLLLSMKNDFQWSDDHDAAFTATKDVLTTAPVLSYYNASKPTRLRTDTSRQEFDFILQQQSNGTTWNLIQAGSYFLTDTELRYATMELEMLSVCWAVMKYNLI